MQLTEMSFVLLPICLICALMPARLLLLVRYFGVMGGGAVLVVGGYGVPTTMVPALLFIGCFVLQLLLGRRFEGQRPVVRILFPFMAASVYAVGTAIVLPHVFDSVIMVYPQRPELGFGTSPLHFGMGNITQCFYLIIACVFCTCSALFLAGRPDELRKQFNTFLLGGYCIAGIALWQLASKITGLPFPDDFFHSNPAWAELSEQAIGGVSRINGPFTEPTVLGAACDSFAFCTGWLLLQGYRHKGLLPLMTLSVVCVVMSTSTAGIITLAGGCLFVVAYGLSGVAPAFSVRLLRASIPVGSLAVLAALLLPVFAPNVTTSLGVILAGTLEKQQTESYEQRTTMDADSYVMAVDTYGLGVGFGSNRPSSLIASMSSQIGIPGLAMLVMFVYTLSRYARRAGRFATAVEERMIIQGIGSSLVASLGTAVLASPSLLAPDFYLSVSLFVATIATIEFSARDVGTFAQPDPVGNSASGIMEPAPAFGQHIRTIESSHGA